MNRNFIIKMKSELEGPVELDDGSNERIMEWIFITVNHPKKTVKMISGNLIWHETVSFWIYLDWIK